MDYKHIFITGPNRSGTTIAARIFAHDTGYDLVLEDDFGYSDLAQLASFIYADYGPSVIQCPFLSHVIHDLPYLIGIDMEECLVVMVHRDIEDIKASESRAKDARGNSIAFGIINQQRKALGYNADGPDHIAEVCYEAWGRQKPMIPNTLDLQYESLKGHHLWIEQRDFSIRQTSPDDKTDLKDPKPATFPVYEHFKALKDGPTAS